MPRKPALGLTDPITDHDRLNPEQVSIGTMGIGTGALVAGLFGMNVRLVIFERSDIYLIPSEVDQPIGDNPLCLLGNVRIVSCHSAGCCIDWFAKVSCLILPPRYL